MLAVQPDNWRNRSIHADMESCSQKSCSISSTQRSTHGERNLRPWRGRDCRFLAVTILNHVFTRKHVDLYLCGNSAPVNSLFALAASQGLRLRRPTGLHSAYASLVIDGTTNMTVSKVVLVYSQSILYPQRN